MPPAPKRVTLISDAQELEFQNDPRLDLPGPVDEERAARQARAAAPPTGEGLYVRACADCDRHFRSEDRYACICPDCDRADSERYRWSKMFASNSQFRRRSGYE